MSTTIKLYDPIVAELWMGIARRYAVTAERELYEIFPKTIGINSHFTHLSHPYSIREKALIQPLAGHAMELSYKALAVSQLKPIKLQHGSILEIHKDLPKHIQDQIESVYVSCMHDSYPNSNYVEDLENFLQTMFLSPSIRYGANESEPQHISGKRTKPERERYRYSDITLMCQYMRFIKKLVEIAYREVVIALSKQGFVLSSGI